MIVVNGQPTTGFQKNAGEYPKSIGVDLPTMINIDSSCPFDDKREHACLSRIPKTRADIPNNVELTGQERSSINVFKQQKPEKLLKM